MDVSGKKALVVGMAKSGTASARLLIEKGAKVTVYDAKREEDLKDSIRAEIEKLPAAKLLGADDETVSAYVEGIDLMVLSPGVPLNLPFIRKAYALEKKVIAEMELGYLFSNAEFVAITGTNGKTTTTALTGEIFKNAGKNTYVLGNIGIPISEMALQTRPGDVVVAETAALQLETTETFRPRACTVLNITEDHLNRYGTMENYTNAKAMVFQNQTKDDFCVLNYDNEIARSLAPRVKSRLLWFSRKCEPGEGAFVRGDDMVFVFEGLEKYICNIKDIRIPGSHNLENALAACALASAMGIPAQAIRRTLAEFPGVEHRIEFVKEVNGVRYINDSKGTNPDATIKAIEAMTAPTILLLGGSEKNSDFVPMFETMTEHITGIVALGATAGRILEAARVCGYRNIVRADGFRDAVLKARDMAKPGMNVLLSPACASYDMFTDFEERGRVFKEIVNSL
jgi:UDP-N-acetylmuramoylalanine--D-glutamate ligase